jgi:hypothetical protein
MDLIIQLARPSEELTLSQQDKQVFSENIEHSLFSIAGQNQKARGQTKTQSPTNHDNNKVDEDDAMDSLDVVGGPSVEDEASEFTTNTTTVELGTPVASGLGMDSTEDMSNSHFEGSADLASLGLLDHMEYVWNLLILKECPTTNLPQHHSTRRFPKRAMSFIF